MKISRITFIMLLLGYSFLPVHNAVAATKTISITPVAFLRNTESPNIVSTIYYGLRWHGNNTEHAGFYLNRPADWDGTSPVKIHITFALGGNGAGAVNWRMKLNTYTPGSGEWLTNPATRNADSLLTFASGPSSLRIYSQTFTIQAEELNTEPMWSVYFLRGDATNSETFTGDLYVMDATVEYNAVNRTTMFPIAVPSSK